MDPPPGFRGRDALYKAVEACEQELKILMLPKDPNDDKNVIVDSVEGMRCTRCTPLSYFNFE